MNSPEINIHDRASALRFLFGRINYERKDQIPYRSRDFKLDRMRRLLERLGQPQRGLPVVHIAGTKGKGSTASMIAGALVAAGYRTGLFTSPHIERLEERFVINGQSCLESQLVEVLADVARQAVAMDRMAELHGPAVGPTFFEITTAAALLHFQRQNVDCAVLEVGLGGRLDSTNVCESIISIITSISFDHTRQLGNSLAEIAGEKAGIIRDEVPVITGVQQAEPFAVIRDIAQRHAAPLLALGRDFHCVCSDPVLVPLRRGEPADASVQRTTLDYRERVGGVDWNLSNVRLRLVGAHQAANAAVAIAALQQLRRTGWNISTAAIRAGLENAYCPARVELVQQRPAVVVDAAHNAASVRALLRVITHSIPSRRRLLLFATSRDKKARAMLEQLLPQFDRVFLTRFVTNPRAVEPQHLADLGHQVCHEKGLTRVELETLADPETAWEAARQWAEPDDLICITGSFFLAAELYHHFASPTAVVAECT